MRLKHPIPIIDIFAGPGGLSEGFARLPSLNQVPAYEIALSIEKDEWAHKTLELRSFFRHLKMTDKADDYYRYLRGPEYGGIERETLFSLHPKSASLAKQQAWHQSLGLGYRCEISKRINSVLKGYSHNTPWILLGGPPCQAYSIIGRARMRPVEGEDFDRDERHTLYEEYLAVLESHRPHIFIMENVKGLLSSELQSMRIIKSILKDLRNAAGRNSYELFSFSKSRKATGQYSLFDENEYEIDPRDFIIKCEKYGIPQNRHRLIICGVRSDLIRGRNYSPPILEQRNRLIPVKRVLSGLPRLRSGLTNSGNSAQALKFLLAEAATSSWLSQLSGNKNRKLSKRINETLSQLRHPHSDQGGRFVPSSRLSIDYAPSWYLNHKLKGICNHETRQHMLSDLYRYLYASCYASVYRVSPKLSMFPTSLLPNHANVSHALGHGMFNDRFRVQVADHPASTITCHLAKDGHYYIHYDPTQVRSLTVREAARIQTFPDDYFFEGPRTSQFIQVGNAVPPLLAYKLARIISKVLHEIAT